MLRLGIDTKRNAGKYEIRATIHYVHATATPEKIQDTLKTVRLQLEQTLPTSFKTKYMVNSEGLVLRIPAGNAANANRLGRRVEDILQRFIRTVKV